MQSKRHVRGSLFAEYVRMIRRRKDIDWTSLLGPDDGALVSSTIVRDAWYPMDAFERLGNAIFDAIAAGDLERVRLWGRFSASEQALIHPTLVAPRDPVESINRFRVLRSTWFDFDALEVSMLHDDESKIFIAYHMGAKAEEAASWQTLGFFEGLVELAGATDVDARFAQRTWAGDARTLVSLRWRSGS
ncbi:MAG: hypothetical protein IT379_23190 [Deltaproteobacteria bacterium]|nr:hypothetical protein [Deltaproteobacteria bacterium]